MRNIALLSLLLVLMSGTAWAQESGSWDWRIAPYLWTVGIDGELSAGPIDQDIDVSFSDILSDLDFGGSVFAGIGKGRHAFHVDYTYLRLKPDATPAPSPPYPPESTISSKMTTNILEAAYNFRFDGDAFGPALVLGARYWSIDLRLTPNIAGPSLPVNPPVQPPFPTEPVENGPSWWDWFVGVRTENQISTNWDFGFYGTIGGGDSDTPWTAQAVFARRFSNDNRLALGVRIWGVDYSEKEGVMNEFTRLDATFTGFLIGYEFN